MPTINDIKPRAFRSIPIKVMEEIKIIDSQDSAYSYSWLTGKQIKWVDGKAYAVSYI